MAKAKPKTKVARVLEKITVGGKEYPTNSLVELPLDVASQLHDMKAIDLNDEAVAYLKSEGVMVVSAVEDVSSVEGETGATDTTEQPPV